MRPTCNDLGQERPWYSRSVRRSGVVLATATIAGVFSIAGVTPAKAEDPVPPESTDTSTTQATDPAPAPTEEPAPAPTE